MASPPTSPGSGLPLQYIKGVGPRRAEVLADAGIVTPTDVLFHIPHGYIERSAVPSVDSLYQMIGNNSVWANNQNVSSNITGEVSLVVVAQRVDSRVVGKNRKMLSATFTDETGGAITGVFWNAIQYFSRLIKEGSTYVISGTPEIDAKFNRLTITHPDVELITDDEVASYREGVILPKYSMSQPMKNAGITMNLLRSIVAHVIDDALEFEGEFLPHDLLRKHDLVNRKTALRDVHQPSSLQAIQRAKHRLKYEELFEFQLFLATRNARNRQPDRGLLMDPKSPSARALLQSLEFELTSAQKRVINEIIRDMSSGMPMNRLLQGDVGSGKTIVALLCMLNAVDNGFQAAIMAPTEILAEQHMRSITHLTQNLATSVVLLTGSTKKRERTEILDRITTGEANIIVGTHALLESYVEYNSLGLVVIDEQHRFGVAQRSELRALGKRSNNNKPPHILVMSATPIPRTLSMTLYGDLELSVIDELPKGRRPISTHVVPENNVDGMFQFVREQLDAGRQAYIVYPLVEKSEKLDLKSAVEHYNELKETHFSNYKLGLLHGQMKWQEKDQTMREFLAGEYDVLVATTVIEVGVDVSNATVMVVENADRFGLSQLHQLRGRVGRGSQESYCFLVAPDWMGKKVKRSQEQGEQANAVTRLRTMEATTDGFKIAEEDLKLRGPGDMMGTRQSGVPEFRFADIVRDAAIISEARTDAFSLVQADPHLRKPEHKQLRDRMIEAFENGTLSVA